jgi:hypothetical protein
VANHVVQDRIVFPGAGYLEMARAAKASASMGPAATAATLADIFFLQPLVISGESVDAVVTIELHTGFDIRSTDDDSDEDMAHCSGSLTTEPLSTALSFAHARERFTNEVDVATLFAAFARAGLQYGPGFRRLSRVWSASDGAAAELKRRDQRQFTHVHPADLDGALQLSACAAVLGDATTRLPFAVDGALLSGGGGRLRAATEPCDGDAVAVTLESARGNAIAQLDGFKARAFRAAPAHDARYVSKWTESKAEVVASAHSAALLLLSDEPAPTSVGEQLGTGASLEELALQLPTASAVVLASALQRSAFDRQALCVVAAALTLAQAVAKAADQMNDPALWIVVSGVQCMHAGPWGLARSVRTETMLPLRCAILHGVSVASAAAVLLESMIPDEPEMAVRSTRRRVPRLAHAPPLQNGDVLLAFLPRGALSNLRIEELPSFATPPRVGEVQLSVRAVGLNFRDVLNVLGEYPCAQPPVDLELCSAAWIPRPLCCMLTCTLWIVHSLVTAATLVRQATTALAHSVPPHLYLSSPQQSWHSALDTRRLRASLARTHGYSRPSRAPLRLLRTSRHRLNARPHL